MNMIIMRLKRGPFDELCFIFLRFTAGLAWAQEKGLDAQIVHESEALFHLRKSVQEEREKGNGVLFEETKKWIANVDDPSNIARLGMMT